MDADDLVFGEQRTCDETKCSYRCATCKKCGRIQMLVYQPVEIKYINLTIRV